MLIARKNGENSYKPPNLTPSELESLPDLQETNLVTVIKVSAGANLVDTLVNNELREYFEKRPERLQQIRELHSTGFDVALSSPAFRKTPDSKENKIERIQSEKVNRKPSIPKRPSITGQLRRLSLSVAKPRASVKKSPITPRNRKPAGNCCSKDETTETGEGTYGSYVRHSVIVNNEKIFLPSYNYHCTCEVADSSETFATAF